MDIETGGIEGSRWIAPDGTAHDGSDADPRSLLAQGWIGIVPAGPDEWWRILPPPLPATRTAYEATARIVRRPGGGTPKPLAASLSELFRRTWNDQRFADPAAALQDARHRLRQSRITDAISAILAAGETPAEPDLARIEAGLSGFRDALAGLYETAHSWRYGPAGRTGPAPKWTSDPDALRAGAEGVALRLAEGSSALGRRLHEIGLATLGIAPEAIGEPDPVPEYPGLSAAEALGRTLAFVRAEIDASLDRRRAGEPHAEALPEPSRKAGQTVLSRVAELRRKVAFLDDHAATYLNLARGASPERQKDLASGYLSHECGRTALEIRHYLSHGLVPAVAAFRESLSEAPGAVP